MTVARSLIHKNNVLKGGIDSPSKLAKSSMIGMYQVKKVSSGVSRFKFCWSKVNPQTVTIFENKMPSIDRIETNLLGIADKNRHPHFWLIHSISSSSRAHVARKATLRVQNGTNLKVDFF